MNKAFVRGGQLSLHSLRMLKQVCIVFIQISVVMFVITLAYYCSQKITLYQLKICYWQEIAQIQTELGRPNIVLEIDQQNGLTTKMTARQIITNPEFISIRKHVIDVFWRASKISSLMILLVIGVLTIFFLLKGGKFARDRQVRGNQLTDAKNLHKKIKKHNKGIIRYSIGNIPYPLNSETTHTLIAGTTGAGKTILISDLINQVKKQGDKIIIYDKMGTYTERFYEEDKDTLLNPFDKRSPNWSIFDEVNEEANFDAIAAALIPFDKSSSDPFWTKAARTIFSEVCSALLKKGGVSNSELVCTLLKKNLSEAAELVRGTAAGALIDEKSPKTALSVMSMLSTHLKCLKFLQDGDNRFSIKKWIKDDNESGCIFMTSSGDLHATLTPLFSGWLDIAISSILSLPKNSKRRIWIILDELPSLHSLPSLEQGLAETRQFGGCFVLSIQSISQLRDRYGMNGSQTISSLCNTKVFLRAGDYESARWYSDNIGVTEVEEYKEALSYGAHQMRDGVNINHHKHSKHLVLPTEITGLPAKEGIFSMGENFPAAKVKFEYTDWPNISVSLQKLESQTPKDSEESTTQTQPNNTTKNKEDIDEILAI